MGGEELVACCGINAFQTADVKAFVVILELALMDGDVPKLKIETPPPPVSRISDNIRVFSNREQNWSRIASSNTFNQHSRNSCVKISFKGKKELDDI